MTTVSVSVSLLCVQTWQNVLEQTLLPLLIFVWLCICVGVCVFFFFCLCVDVLILVTTLSVGLLLPPYISPKDL